MRRRRETEIVQVNLRLREGLRRRVLRESEKAERSLNAELVHLIEEGLKYAETKDALEGQWAGAEAQYQRALELQEKSIERLSEADKRLREADGRLEAASRIYRDMEAKRGAK